MTEEEKKKAIEQAFEKVLQKGDEARQAMERLKRAIDKNKD